MLVRVWVSWRIVQVALGDRVFMIETWVDGWLDETRRLESVSGSELPRVALPPVTLMPDSWMLVLTKIVHWRQRQQYNNHVSHEILSEYSHACQPRPVVSSCVVQCLERVCHSLRTDGIVCLNTMLTLTTPMSIWNWEDYSPVGCLIWQLTVQQHDSARRIMEEHRRHWVRQGFHVQQVVG